MYIYNVYIECTLECNNNKKCRNILYVYIERVYSENYLLFYEIYYTICDTYDNINEVYAV